MASIRKTKTATGATAVQVVRYRERKVLLLKHVGSAKSTEEIDALVQSADVWIQKNTGQLSFLSAIQQRVLPVARCTFVGVRYTIAYHTLVSVARLCGFDVLEQPLAIDLAIIRMFEPCSKRRSRELLERYFGIAYGEATLYRSLQTMDRHKEAAENIAVRCAKREFSFDCSLVFYDVTTLYFETFKEDEEENALRKTGFSKDQKSQQPQIVVGLLVTSQGFPLGYELFKGNTFEGHTMLPVLQKFTERHGIVACTVVADAAMLSFENMEELQQKHFSYIVGARVANLSSATTKKITTSLPRRNGATIRLKTEHGDLVCSFSTLRFRKDKHEMEKQIARAKTHIISSKTGKRPKFVQATEASFRLNKTLIEKAKKLLGIKGYVTNIPRESMNDDQVIMHYRNLWRVEQTFRMAKSDLEVRPIFHQTEEAIRSHLLICFLALVISKYMELKTDLSLQQIIDRLKSVGEAKIVDSSSNEEFTIPSIVSDKVGILLKKLGLHTK